MTIEEKAVNIRSGRLWLTIVVVGTVVALAAWRWFVPRSVLEQTRRDVRAAFRSVDAMMPLTAAPEDLRAALDQMDFEGGDGVPDDRRSALLDETAAFLRARFAGGSPADYRTDRIRRGYVWRKLDALCKAESLDQSWAAAFSEPFPTSASPGELFDRMATWSLEYGDGCNRPVAITAERKGMVTAFGTWNASSPQPPLMVLTGELGTHRWHALVTSSLRQWLVPPRSSKHILQRFGSVDIALTGIVMEFADGARRPLMLSYVWDPINKRWYLDGLFITAILPEKPSLMEF